LQLLGPGHATWAYWVTLDPEIKTLWDIEGKKITIGGAGTPDPEKSTAVLGGLGWTQDVDFTGLLLDGHDAADALIEGRADAMYVSGSMLCDSIAVADILRDIYFIKYPEDMWDEMDAAKEAKGLGTQHGTVPAALGLYRGLKEDYETYSGSTDCFVNRLADEEIVYKVTKALWEHTETLVLIHPVGKEYNIENVKKYVASDYSMPIHPGALRYYKEVGILK